MELHDPSLAAAGRRSTKSAFRPPEVHSRPTSAMTPPLLLRLGPVSLQRPLDFLVGLELAERIHGPDRRRKPSNERDLQDEANDPRQGTADGEKRQPRQDQRDQQPHSNILGLLTDPTVCLCPYAGITGQFAQPRFMEQAENQFHLLALDWSGAWGHKKAGAPGEA